MSIRIKSLGRESLYLVIPCCDDLYPHRRYRAFLKGYEVLGMWITSHGKDTVFLCLGMTELCPGRIKLKAVVESFEYLVECFTVHAGGISTVVVEIKYRPLML